uniref:Uncharacterized protein n=1 Tax=Quercus lobata TaxID=97700 RepID=A0A7N2N7H4_QUELO
MLLLETTPLILGIEHYRPNPLSSRVFVWRVGNGKDIRILGDKWLPRGSSHKLSRPDFSYTKILGMLQSRRIARTGFLEETMATSYPSQESFDEEKVALVVTIAWLLWSNQNSVRHGGTRKTSEALVQWASHYLIEYTAATDSIVVRPEIINVT